MKKTCLAVILLSLNLFWAKYSFAIDNNIDKPFYNFHRLNEAHGLSNNVINDILQDRIGFIWIATDDGLFRYDGANFLEFKNDEGNEKSLPHNSVQALYQDNENNIWALTDFGIGIFNQKTGEISRILPGDDLENLPHKSATSICSGGNGVNYQGTFGGGVVVADNGVFEKLIPKSDPDNIGLTNQLVTIVI